MAEKAQFIAYCPILAIKWRITTGGDDKRADSIVSVVTVLKSGGRYTAQLGQGQTWHNGSVQPPSPEPPFSVGVNGNNGSGVSGNGLPQCNKGDIDHLELQFQSYAGEGESTDNWNIAHLTVTATTEFDGIYDFNVYDHDWGGNGLRMKGLGSLTTPWSS